MLNDVDIDRIAIVVVRKMAEAELERLHLDLAHERKLAEIDAEHRDFALRQAAHERRRDRAKRATILLLAIIYVMMFELL